MKILTYSDWKKRIAFDNVIYKDVKRYSLQLNSYERALMNKQIDFYRNNFSLLQVMEHFKKLKSDKDKEIFIKAVLKRQNKILYLPYQLKSYMTKIIRSEFSDFKEFFFIMLNKACNQSKANLMPAFCKSVLGHFYKPVMRKVKFASKQKEIPTVSKVLKPEAIENTARQLIYDLQYDYQLSIIYGRSSIRKNIPISIVDDYGYGKWLSKNVSYNNNRFFIYSNNNRLTDVELKHMVYFNIYPGYGHFYNTVVDDLTKSNCFDNGATFLINGWAMYAMCHNKNTAYSQNFLIEGANIANFLLHGNLEKAYENVYVYLLGKYPKTKALDYMLDYTQYPGHYLSYVLGEFAVEICMNNNFATTPIEFLNNLRQINCGDFFDLFSPKKQKKISKQIITSKVVNRFSVKV